MPKKTVYLSQAFETWFKALKDRVGRARIQARLDRLEDGHSGDCQVIGDGVSELRVHYGPGYRIYFTEKNDEVVILLVGGTKGSQTRDISRAKKMAQEHRT